jgi:predicted adenylyl cyclase CyaB
MRNLEFKAAMRDWTALLTRARSIGAELWGDLRQTDTYFETDSGRLKLRETAGFQAELIYYERAEASEQRESDYTVTPIPDPAGVRDILTRALGLRAVVQKRRTLVLLDTTRIHFDNVEGLGQFIEIEVPVREDQASARARLNSLIAGLGYEWADCIRRSYVDLLLEKQA